MRLKLHKLQETDSKTQELKQQKADGYKKIDEILHHWSLPFVSKAIWTKLISRHYDNLLADHIGIKKTCNFLAWKHYWPTLCHNVEAYLKGFDVCLASKAVQNKPYNDLQLLSIPMHQGKDLLIDFVTGLPISIN